MDAVNVAVPALELHWKRYTLRQLLQRIFIIYRQNAISILSLGALEAAVSIAFNVPCIFGQTYIDVHFPSYSMALLSASILASLVFVALAHALLYGGIANITLAAERDTRASIGETLKLIVPQWMRLFSAYLLAEIRILGWSSIFGSIIALVSAIGWAVGRSRGLIIHAGQQQATGAQAMFTLAALFSLIVAIIAGTAFFFWVFGRYFVFLPVVIDEGCRASAALNRSITLSKQNRKNIYAVLLIVVCWNMVASIPIFLSLGHRLHQLHQLRAAGHLHVVLPPSSFVVRTEHFLVFVLMQVLLIAPTLGIGIALCYSDLMARSCPPVGLEPVTSS